MKKNLSEKQIITQTKMKDNRYSDYVNLREKIKQKLIWIDDEIIRANEIIKQHENKINVLKIGIMKLDVAKITLNDLLVIEKKEEIKNSKNDIKEDK